MEIKVMQYNIKHGFHNEQQDPSGNFQFFPERMESARKVVLQESPDILVLNEASFGRNDTHNKEKGTFIDYESTFEYPYRFHKFIGAEWGSALFSRFHIISAENYSMHNRTFIRSLLDVNGKVVNLDIAHPHPDLSEWEKCLFFKANLRDIKRPYLLVGDFNACSDQDNYDPEKLKQGFEGYSREVAKKAVDNFMKYCAIPEVRRHDLIDTFIAGGRPFSYTMPTDLASKNKNSGIRMDYIFCSPEFKVVDSYVIQNELTNKASDHHPIVAVLEI